MSLSIDGKTHTAKCFVSFDDEFPKANSNREVGCRKTGQDLLIYILNVSTPKWKKENGRVIGVVVTLTYWITQVIKKSYEKGSSRVKKVPIVNEATLNLMAEMALDESITAFHKEKLSKEMDKALEARDFERAKQIHEKMQKME